jgi:hypothetical protein
VRQRDCIALGLAAAIAGVGNAFGRESSPPGAGDVAPGASAAPGATDQSLPAGHPPVGEPGTPAHGESGGAVPGLFEPPEDVEQPDPMLPAGTVAVDLFDANDQPVANETVTLGMLINSIAKGDSRKHVQASTNDRGRVVFGGLETASNIAYRVSSGFQGGAFAAPPFQLEHAKAMHVVLHVYPVTHDLQHALIVAEVVVAAEVREDRIQVEEVLKLYNLGRTAWVPEDVRMALPDGFTAFNTQAAMSDQRVEEVERSAALKGTFPPGRHSVDFRWQLPLSGMTDFDFEVGLPPHVAGARVMMPAASEIKLTASGLPPAEIRQDARGQKFLVTERRLRPEDPKLTTLTIGIHGLPTPGPGRLIATLFAAFGVAVGLAFSFSRRLPFSATTDPKTVRFLLLEELGELEQARLDGEVGAKTYARTRGEIMDALARTPPGPTRRTSYVDNVARRLGART